MRNINVNALIELTRPPLAAQQDQFVTQHHDMMDLDPPTPTTASTAAGSERRVSGARIDELRRDSLAFSESSNGVTPSPLDSPTPIPVPAPSTEIYERIVQVGEGTYGKVYKAKNVETGGLVALKRIRMEAEKDGFPVTAVREIKLLQNLRHPNVVDLIEMMVSRSKSFNFWAILLDASEIMS